MAPTKPKARIDRLGYGVLALYAVLIAAGAGAVYGWTFPSDFTSVFSSSSEKTRAQLQTGRMLVSTEDRVHCRSYTFDNATSQMRAGQLTECEDRRKRGGVASSFGIIRDSFNNR